MNFRKLAVWLRKSCCSYPVPPIIQHRDMNLGIYKYSPSVNLWTHRLPFQSGELQICGRSEHPTDEQKRLLELFLPLLPSLTKEALTKLEPPEGFWRSNLPKKLELYEVRFESSGDVELFFEPSLEVDGYDACPMATCSADGQLLSVCWTV